MRDLRQISFVFDGSLDGLDRVLEVDKTFTHPFRLAALVCLRQYIHNVATLFYLAVSGSNQLSNVLIFLSQRSSPPRLCVFTV